MKTDPTRARVAHPSDAGAEQGFGTALIDGPKGEIHGLDDFAYTAWGASRQWVEDHPKAAAAFSRALTAATKKVKSQPDTVTDQVLDNLGTQDRPVVLRTIKAMSPALSDDGCFDPKVVQQTLDTMLRLKITEDKADPAEGDLWTNKYNDC